MWKLGNMVYLVVATTYKMPKSKVGERLKISGIHNLYLLFYQIQVGVTSGCNSRSDHLEDAEEGIEKVHLFADRFVDGAFVFNFTSFVSQVRDPKVLGSEHERHLGV